MKEENTDRLIGARFGGFRIQRKLGEGGMSSVYLAAREKDFEQRVALKLLSEGLHDSSTLLRFRLEQQALGALQHKNIVQMVDAGASEEGIPYLAMDYVDGEPLDQYCNRLRLSVRDRIRLFLQVLDAVDYAHRRFLIHCDLKFTNIFVDCNGLVKLLDFGVSKMLDPSLFGAAEGATKATLRPFTPEFASPEQLALAPLTTATDIYSAGVVLYRLLCGLHPHENVRSNPVKLLRAICENDAVAPGKRFQEFTRIDTEGAEAIARDRGTSSASLAAELSGDLDAILGKTLERRVDARYSTASMMADDLRAFLEQRPVTARASSLRYRAWKYCRRHRHAIASAALVLVVLSAGIGAWLAQAWRANQSKARAEARFRDVRQLTNTLLFDFYEAVTKLPGATPVQEDLVRWSLAYLDELSKQKGADTALVLDLGESYRKLGNILGNPYQNNLGKPQEGIDAISRGLEIVAPLAATMPEDPKVMLATAQLYSARSEVRWLVGEPNLCLRDARTAVELLVSLAGQHPNDYEIQMATAARHEMLADLQGGAYAIEMNMAEAQRNLELAKQYAAKAAAADPTQIRPQRAQVIFQLKLADMAALSDPAEALETYYDALRLFDAMPEAGKQEYASVRTRNALLRSTGWSLTALGKYDEALARYRSVLPAFEEALRVDPTNEQTIFDMAVILREIGEAQHYAGEFEGCVETSARMADLLEELAVPAEATERRAAYGEALLYQGICAARTGDMAGARSLTTRALAIIDKESAPESAGDSMLVRAADSFLIAEPKDLREPAKALRLVERRYTERIADDSYYLMLRADALAQLGRRKEALEVVERAIGNTTPKVNINTWNRLHAIRAAVLAQ